MAIKKKFYSNKLLFSVLKYIGFFLLVIVVLKLFMFFAIVVKTINDDKDKKNILQIIDQTNFKKTSKDIPVMTDYMNYEMGMSFKYPKGWELTKKGESSLFEQIIIESPCNINMDDQCATVYIYPYNNSDAVPYYEPARKSNEVTLNIDGLTITGFDFDYSPINKLEKIYQFQYNNIYYDITYFETLYKNGEPSDPQSLIYLETVGQIIKSIKFM